MDHETQIQRRTDHRDDQGIRGRGEGPGSVPEVRHQRRDVLQVQGTVWGDERVGCEEAPRAGRREQPAEADAGGGDARQRRTEGLGDKKLLTPDVKRRAVRDVMDRHGLSERRACQLADLHRSVFQYQTRDRGDEALRVRLRELANERRRFGYRRLGILLGREGIEVNHKKLFRLYREEGLAVRRRRSRAAFREMRECLDIGWETYGAEREGGRGRVSAGLAALRAAAAKDREAGRPGEDFRERLAHVVGRSKDPDDTPKPEARYHARERPKAIMEKDAGRDGQAAVHKLDGHGDPELGHDAGREARKPSVSVRLRDVLNKPREKLEIEDVRDQEKDQEVENVLDTDRGPGLRH